jgi:RND family efflux transporter MFP subunit
LLAGLLVLPVLVACGRDAEGPAPVRPVRALRVAGPDELMVRSFPGTASAASEVNLSFRVGGTLITREADVGDFFEAGAVLAQLDPRDFEVRLRNVQAQLEKAKAALMLAEDEFGRAQTAHDRGGVSAIELARQREARDAASAQVDSLAATVDAAADQLKYTSLKAPFRGRVVSTYVENFEDVLPKRPIVRLLDRTRVEFEIFVSESLIGYAPYVEDVKIRFDAFEGREFTAAIKEIGEEATQATRTYPVTLVLDQPQDVEILAGMAGDARITSRPPQELAAGGIAIPAAAVFSDGSSGETFVWVVDEPSRTLSRRQVEARQFSKAGLRAQSGLSAGEWIVVAGVHSVTEGQEVRILDVTTGKEVGR